MACSSDLLARRQVQKRFLGCLQIWFFLLGLASLGLIITPTGAQSVYPQAYTFATVAGFAGVGSADGVGNAALFDAPQGIVSDSHGNLFIVDSGNDTIRKVTSSGVVSTIAGLAGNPGNVDGMSSNARFDFGSHVLLDFGSQEYYSVFSAIAMDNAGNLYVADSGNATIRMITPVGTNWVVKTIGIGTNSFSAPSGVAVDGLGNLYVADDAAYSDKIWKIAPVSQGLTNWVASTIVDNNHDGGVGCSGAAVDSSGNVYTVLGDSEVTQITPTGEQNPLAQIRVGNDCSLAVASNGNLYVATDVSSILEIEPTVSDGQTNWVVSTLAGSGVIGSADGTGTNAQLNAPQGIALDGAGNLYVADTGNNLIRKISFAGVVGLLAGAVGTGSADGSGTSARLNKPMGVAVDNSGNIYVTDTGNDTVRTITPAGVVNTLAGLAGYSGNADGVGSNARFNSPEGIGVDNRGNIFVADTGNNTIREITPDGVVSTLAGNSVESGYNDGIGTNALFSIPIGIACASSTNFFVMDSGNDKIRDITFNGSNWVVSTFATNEEADLEIGLFGLGTVFGEGTGIALDNAGNFYVMVTAPKYNEDYTEAGLSCKEVDAAGIIVASSGLSYTDNNPTPPNLAYPVYYSYDPAGVVVDSFGNTYVADPYDSKIFKITPAGAVDVIGGSTNSGSADGVGSDALFDFPSGIAVDSMGDVYVADTYNNTIRKGVFTAYGAANPVGYSPPALTNSVTVWLEPTNANGKWRFPWEFGWHNSGDTESNLVAGNYPVQFSAVPGWLAIPASLTIAGGNTLAVSGPTSYTNQYYATLSSEQASNGGTLTVTLGPNPPTGAAWGFLGQGMPSFSSGYTTNLPTGTYLISFARVNGRVTPPNLSVPVQAGQTAYISENYLLAQSAPSGVLLPYLVPPNEITDLTDYSFGFDGQLQTDVGYGSGAAVQANVVLTAAHLVFNDQNLAYASQAYWYTQEPIANASSGYPSDPMAARGWYMLSGYAAQRTNDMEVYPSGTYTPQAANMDVAALYFLSPVAGGGYAGYLPSDASPNTWLTSTALKMLVGFPVDGSQFDVTNVVPGQMYQTQPQPYPLALSTDPVPDQQVYTANWFLGYPGDSGGALYVQLNGYYYPAAVYLATLYDGTTPYASAVRAIDSEVVNLITNAAVIGDSGTNHTGGGVITIIPDQAININNQGLLEVQLGPPAAVAAGAAWRLSGLSGLNLTSLSDFTNYFSTNWMIAVPATNGFSVNFKPVQGWIQPVDQGVTLIPKVPVTNSGYYTVESPDMAVNLAKGFEITGTTGTTYLIEYRTNLMNGQWLILSTNTLVSGFSKIAPWPPTNQARATYYRAVWLP